MSPWSLAECARYSSSKAPSSPLRHRSTSTASAARLAGTGSADRRAETLDDAIRGSRCRCRAFSASAGQARRPHPGLAATVDKIGRHRAQLAVRALAFRPAFATPSLRRGLRRGGKPPGREILYARSGHEDPFGAQQLALELNVAAISAETSTGSDHPVARYAWRAALTHDVADRSRRARAPGHQRYVPVGRHLAGWDSAHDGQHLRSERSNSRLSHRS